MGYFIITSILILQIVSSSISSAEENSVAQIITSGCYDKGYRYNIQGWVYLHIEGEPYERGYQYGYLASAEIIDMINRWSNLGHSVKFLKNLPINYDKLSEKWWEICKLKSMRFFEKHIPEEYKQEMRGMVDGLNAQEVKLFGNNIEYEDIVASQFVQDVQYAFFKYCLKRFHPIRKIFNGIKEVLFEDANYEEIGYCRAIIATGDATADKGIVIAHATIFEKYIAERCNFIIDIKPSNGYRFIMTGPPGSLWSQEDYYQNEKGIVLTETELVPQGSFNIRKTPKGVRSRTAIQYSASIDEVIGNLQNGNNGLIPNEWLIGDIKTGEIARLEQALIHTPVTRLTNGIFTSSCTPHNNKVERELWGLLPKIFAKIIYSDNNKYTSPVIKKFDELEEKYYGKIDIEVVKKILTTFPISEDSTDVKITNSKLLENMGLITYFGRPVGNEWIASEEDVTKFKGVTVLPPSGWSDIFPCQSNPIDLPFKNNEKNGYNISWKFETNSLGNANYSSSIVDEDIVYTATSSGTVFAIKKATGNCKWYNILGEKSVDPVINDNLLYIGTNKGLHALNKTTGKMKWEQLLGDIICKPVIYKDIIIASFSNGEIHAFNLNFGKEKLLFKFNSSAYISETKNDMIYIGSGISCFGFDINKKEIIWERKTNGPITTSPKISDGTVFVGSWDGALYALNVTTGELKWKNVTGWGIDSTPDVSDGIVFVGSLDNNFYAFNKETGDIKWIYKCKAAIHSNSYVYGEYVFFGCDDGRLYALNKTDGELNWSYSPRYSIKEDDINNYITTPILSNPFVEEGVVYFGANGSVYALDAQTFETQKIFPEKVSDIRYDMVLLMSILSIVAVFLIFLYLRIKGKIKNKEEK